jgi:hypothetical protein
VSFAIKSSDSSVATSCFQRIFSILHADYLNVAASIIDLQNQLLIHWRLLFFICQNEMGQTQGLAVERHPFLQTLPSIRSVKKRRTSSPGISESFLASSV